MRKQVKNRSLKDNKSFFNFSLALRYYFLAILSSLAGLLLFFSWNNRKENPLFRKLNATPTESQIQHLSRQLAKPKLFEKQLNEQLKKELHERISSLRKQILKDGSFSSNLKTIINRITEIFAKNTNTYKIKVSTNCSASAKLSNELINIGEKLMTCSTNKSFIEELININKQRTLELQKQVNKISNFYNNIDTLSENISENLVTLYKKIKNMNNLYANIENLKNYIPTNTIKDFLNNESEYAEKFKLSNSKLRHANEEEYSFIKKHLNENSKLLLKNIINNLNNSNISKDTIFLAIAGLNWRSISNKTINSKQLPQILFPLILAGLQARDKRFMINENDSNTILIAIKSESPFLPYQTRCMQVGIAKQDKTSAIVTIQRKFFGDKFKSLAPSTIDFLNNYGGTKPIIINCLENHQFTCRVPISPGASPRPRIEQKY